jgi:hypothetical protein
MPRVSRATAALAIGAFAAAAGWATFSFAHAAEPPSQSPAVRVQIAVQTAESTLRLVKPARSWLRLPGVPLRERRLIGSRALENDNLSREERAKLQTRATFWITRSTPRAILAYVRSKLPRDATAHGESSSGTSYAPSGPIGPNTSTEIERHYKPELWRQEFTLPPISDVLRGQALTVYVARATHSRFVIRLEGSAVWEGIRPSFSLLGANVHAITITNTFAATRRVGPSPVFVSDPSLVQQMVALVNAIPIFEDKGATFSCPSEPTHATSAGSFVVTFAEQPGAVALATLKGEPYGCGQNFLPVISVAGHPPLELSVEPELVPTINRIGGLHLPQG